MFAATKAATEAADVQVVERTLARMHAMKKRHGAEGRKACQDYETAQAQKKAIEDQKTAVRQQLTSTPTR